MANTDFTSYLADNLWLWIPLSQKGAFPNVSKDITSAYNLVKKHQRHIALPIHFLNLHLYLIL